MQKQFGSGLTCCVFSSDTSVMCGSSDGQLIEVDLRNIRYVLHNHYLHSVIILRFIHNCNRVSLIIICRSPLRTVMTSSEITSLQMADDRKCITGTGIQIHLHCPSY